jgi:hypothetical protein
MDERWKKKKEKERKRERTEENEGSVTKATGQGRLRASLFRQTLRLPSFSMVPKTAEAEGWPKTCEGVLE